MNLKAFVLQAFVHENISGNTSSTNITHMRELFTKSDKFE